MRLGVKASKFVCCAIITLATNVLAEPPSPDTAGLNSGAGSVSESAPTTQEYRASNRKSTR